MGCRRGVTAFAAVLCVGCAVAVDERTMAESTRNGLLDGDEEEATECADGDGQSPIDLPLKIARSALPDLRFDYQESHVAIANTGHSVQYSYDPGSTLWVGEDPYQLIQFHFHAHSEHSLGGFLTPLELHLVHKNEAEQLLVVGALVVPGWHNETLDAADWPELPSLETGEVDFPDDNFNARELVPGGPTYRYTGSLTAPPCSNDVSWIVFRRPIVMSEEQIATFTTLYPDNYRDVQPLGDRELLFGK